MARRLYALLFDENQDSSFPLCLVFFGSLGKQVQKLLELKQEYKAVTGEDYDPPKKKEEKPAADGGDAYVQQPCGFGKSDIECSRAAREMITSQRISGHAVMDRTYGLQRL